MPPALQPSASATRVPPRASAISPARVLDDLPFSCSEQRSSSSYSCSSSLHSSPGHGGLPLLPPQKSPSTITQILRRSFHCLFPFSSILHHTLDPFRVNRGHHLLSASTFFLYRHRNRGCICQQACMLAIFGLSLFPRRASYPPFACHLAEKAPQASFRSIHKIIFSRSRSLFSDPPRRFSRSRQVFNKVGGIFSRPDLRFRPLVIVLRLRTSPNNTPNPRAPR